MSRQAPGRLDRARPGRIRVPASIGNVGAGFDTLSVALRLYTDLEVEPGVAGAGLQFDFGDLALDGENLIAKACTAIAEGLGVATPDLEVTVRTEIPMCAGLGSSAAATVAGLRLFEHAAGARPPEELLAVATAIEGHPDNAAAALLGGLVGSCVRDDGSVTALSSRWPEAVRFVIATPDVKLSTPDARRVLPASVDMADAVFGMQRVALLLQSLESGRIDLLREALRDRLHQPYRQPLVPGLERMLALEHPDLLGVCLSGSGPSVVALAERVEPVAALVADVYAELGLPCAVRTLAVHQ